ncbi:MAG: DUF5947 family protein [Solirubrobacterales bacterium]
MSESSSNGGPENGGSSTGNGGNGSSAGKQALKGRIDARRRSDLVSGLRRFADRPTSPSRPASKLGTAPASSADADEWCELCGAGLPSDHRHLIHLDERRLLCACETCWSVRSGEAAFRPAGVRTEWLEGFDLPDEAWASFNIPVGLAFFMRTGDPDRVVSFYPSPAGATESEIDAASWERLRELNPPLQRLEPDSEALIVNRMSEPHEHAIAPIDDCYKLVGLIKTAWEGISGGTGPELAIAQFFAELRVKAVTRGEATNG